jgi:hypothetical protein
MIESRRTAKERPTAQRNSTQFPLSQTPSKDQKRHRRSFRWSVPFSNPEQVPKQATTFAAVLREFRFNCYALLCCVCLARVFVEGRCTVQLRFAWPEFHFNVAALFSVAFYSARISFQFRCMGLLYFAATALKRNSLPNKTQPNNATTLKRNSRRT